MIPRGKCKINTCTSSGTLLIWSRNVAEPTRAQQGPVESAGRETGLCPQLAGQFTDLVRQLPHLTLPSQSQARSLLFLWSQLGEVFGRAVPR